MNQLQLSQTIAEFGSALLQEPHGLIDHLHNETPAADVHLIYTPLQARTQSSEQPVTNTSPIVKNTPNLLKQSTNHSEITSSNEPVAISEEAMASLPVNFRCSLCSDRMYPVRKYYRQGKLPILVIHHAGNFKAGQVRRDQSQNHFMGSPEEDELFTRMLLAVQKTPADLHFQEYLACHFNPERSMEEDWNERGRSCLNHLSDTIQREHIKLLILTGAAALLLLGEEKAQESSKAGSILPLPLGAGESEVPTLTIRSPLSLLALEQKRLQARQAGNQQAYSALLATEKQIKNQILATLKSAFLNIGN